MLWETFGRRMTFKNSSSSVTNHFCFSVRATTHIVKNVLMQSDACTHPILHSHIKNICKHFQQILRLTNTQNSIPTHLLVFPLSLNSFGTLIDWESSEDTATDVSGMHLSKRPECMCVCLRSCKCQNKETVQWIFDSSTLPLPRGASQCWPLRHAGMHSKADKHKQTQTHTCSVSMRSWRLRGSRLQRFRAGATTVQTHLPSGSEAVLYTCQPSSEPGYKPCTQTHSVLMKSLQEDDVTCAFNRRQERQSETRS